MSRRRKRSMTCPRKTRSCHSGGESLALRPSSWLTSSRGGRESACRPRARTYVEGSAGWKEVQAFLEVEEQRADEAQCRLSPSLQASVDAGVAFIVSNAGRAVVPGLSESSVSHGSIAMIGSYPDATAGGDSSGDVGAVDDGDGDGDGDSDGVDMAAHLSMQAEIEATRQQADDAEEQVANVSAHVLGLKRFLERLEEQVAASTAPASSPGETRTAVQGGDGGGRGGGGGGVGRGGGGFGMRVSDGEREEEKEEEKEGEEKEWGEDELQRSRRNSNEGRAVVPGLFESSVGDGSSAMIGSYPGLTAGGDSSGDVGAVDDGDGDDDFDDLDVEAYLSMQAEIGESIRRQF
ncbi:unnamed protein product [Scytosiphon promiscuus]